MSPSRWLAVAAFVPLFYINAYVCDDAFIMLRVVDNLVQGHGLRWNTIERVQVFTSPLHTLLTALPYAVLHDPGPLPDPTRAYSAAMGLSFVLSMLALVELVRSSPRAAWSVCAVAVLLSSQALVTFTSSGLETPLLYLLLAAFTRRYLWKDRSNGRVQLELVLLFSLTALTRLDTALLVLPAVADVVLTAVRRDGLRAIPRMAMAVLPLAVWFAFALVYFGFLVPNTYYAKLAVDADFFVLLKMGFAYLGVGLLQDPITIVVLAVAIPAAARHPRTRWIGAGLMLQVGYVVLIGGDFIGLRFLAPALLVACMVGMRLLEGLALPRLQQVLLTFGFVVYNALLPGSPLRVPIDGPNARDVRYYFEAARLSAWRPGRSFPFAPFHRVASAADCRRSRQSTASVQILDGGLAGFCMGPRHVLLSPAGITEPLVARLPLRVTRPFYPGHLVKAIPAGYEETVRTGRNQLADPALAAYWSALERVTRAGLFSAGRWSAIWQLNVSTRRYPRPYAASAPPYPAEFYYRHETLGEEWSRLLTRPALASRQTLRAFLDAQGHD